MGLTLTQSKYTVKADDTYETVAKHLVSQCETYKQFENTQSFIENIVTGLKYYLYNRRVVAGETILLIDNVDFYLKVVPIKSVGKTRQDNRLKDDEDATTTVQKLSHHLFFNIKEYYDFKNYCWTNKESEYKYKECEVGYNETNINGDKQNASDVKDGYVYLFKNNDELVYSFVIKDGKYTEVKLTESDCTYENIVSPERPCGMLSKHFDDQGFEKQQYQFVFSKVKLTKQRLFGGDDKIPKLTPSDFCSFGVPTIYNIRDLNTDQRIAPLILHEYQNRKRSVTGNFYELSSSSFKGYNVGISIHFPDPIKELNRRAKVFQKRYNDYYGWANLESRVQQKFLYTTAKSLVDNDSSMRNHVDEERMHEWNKKYNEDKYLHGHKVHYGIKNLVEWLENKELNQCLLNHLASDNKEDVLKAVEAYENALTDIDQHGIGMAFYKRALNDKNSFLNLVLGFSDSEYAQTKAIKLLLNKQLINQDLTSASSTFARKAEQALLGLAKKVAPEILKVLGNKTMLNLSKRLISSASSGSGVIATTMVKPLSKLAQQVEVIDVDKLGKSLTGVLEGVAITRVVAFFEVVNVFFALKTLSNDPEHRKRNMASVLGAAIDFGTSIASQKAASDWLFSKLGKNYWVKGGTKIGKTLVPGLNLVSGAIDCFVGVDSAMEAYKHGEIGLCVGYSLYATGGAITAVGAGLVITAAKTTVGSGGTLAEVGGVMLVAGVVVEGIGLAVTTYWDNREIKDWLSKSIFGDEAEFLKKEDLKTLTNVDDVIFALNNTRGRDLIAITSPEIKQINKILCRFFIDASFEQSESRFNNRTTVKFEIEPALISENAIIRFKGVKAHAEARIAEYFQFGNKFDLQVGGSGSLNPEIHLDKIKDNPKYVEKDKNGRIKKVFVNLYYDMDIDNVEGEIEIDFNNGTLQTHTEKFNESAAFYE